MSNKGTVEEKPVQSKGVASRSCPSKLKRRKLTLREQRLIKALPHAKSISDAMRKAGYAESLINSGSRDEILHKPTVIECMEKHGLTDDLCMKTHMEGMKATKVISAMVIRGKPDSIADEKDGMADAHSMTKDFVEVDDFAVRHKYLETAYKLKGHLKDKEPLELKGDIRVVFEVQK
jgi:hypothetical protein